MKLMMWLAVIGLVVAAFYVRRSSARPSMPKRSPDTHFAPSGAESMVCCACCGIHFPASEALGLGNLAYCSTEHLGKPAQR